MPGFGFEGVPVIFGIFAAIIICLFIVAAVKGISTWNRNNHSPRLTVEATVVGKREDISGHHPGVSGDSVSAVRYSTEYFVTFQFESGDRLELSVSGSEYGMLAENDYGKLSFQGTRFLGFERM